MSTIFADLFANARTFNPNGGPGINKAIVHELTAMRELLGDPTYDAVGLVATTSNEIQRIKQFSINPATPATFVLTFTINNVVYTTSALAFGALAATVQTAVDVALAGKSGYVAGDVAVTGVALSAGIQTLTFSGASVDGENIGQTTITLTVPNVATIPVTTTTPGVAATTDEVQHVLRFVNNPTGGSYALTINTAGKAGVTTAAIAYNADHTAVQGAINTAMTASSNKPAGWTNNDIVVTGAGLTAADLVITFSGTSVTHADQGLTTIDTTLLTTSTAYLASPSEDTTTAGSAVRPALATLKICGIIDSIPTGQGDSPSGVSPAYGFQTGVNPNQLSDDTKRVLCVQAEIEEERPGLAAELFTILGISA